MKNLVTRNIFMISNFSDHLVQILAIHLLIEKDHLNIQKQNVDIAHIQEAEAETEITIKRIIKVLETVIQKEEKDIDIILGLDLQIVQKGKLDLFQEKSLEVVQVVHNLM